MSRSRSGRLMVRTVLVVLALVALSCATTGNKELLKEPDRETALEPIPRVEPFPIRLSEETRDFLEASNERELLQELAALFPENAEHPPGKIDFSVPYGHELGVKVTLATTATKFKQSGDAFATLRVLDWGDPTLALLRCEGKASVTSVKTGQNSMISDAMNAFWRTCRQNASADLLRKLDNPEQRDKMARIARDYREWKDMHPATVLPEVKAENSRPTAAAPAGKSFSEQDQTYVPHAEQPPVADVGMDTPEQPSVQSSQRAPDLTDQEPAPASTPHIFGQELMGIRTLAPPVQTFPQPDERAAVSENRHVFGEDISSVYMVSRKGNELLLSPDIPDERGNLMKGKGMLISQETLGPDMTPVNAGYNGILWTPRTERIGKVDLAVEGHISDAPGFSFDAFKKHPSVIAFKNGYGVNLFGASIQGGRIGTETPCRGAYQNGNGQRLPGRLLQEEWTGNKQRIVEMVLR